MSRGFDPEVWAHRKRSKLVKDLMRYSNIQTTDMAKYLGVTKAYFDTKLARNSFSFDELIIAAEAAGLKFALVDENNDIQETFDANKWFDDDPGTIQQVAKVRVGIAKREALRLEYEAKKKELDDFAKTYGLKK